MKALQFSLLAGLLAAAGAIAQPLTNSGRIYVSGDGVFTGDSTTAAAVAAAQEQMPHPLGGVPNGSAIAESVTPEIQALARGLENDPQRIFDYVHDHIRHVLYYGSKKGAPLTLLEKSGNDFDQCALLVALLRAAGYNNVSYGYGLLQIPYDGPDGNDVHHWLGVSLVNTNWTTTFNYLVYLLNTRNYPVYRYYGVPYLLVFDMGDNNTVSLPRVWVTLVAGTNTYYLDPAFKMTTPITGLDIASVVGFSASNLLNAAGGTVGNSYVQSVSEANVRSSLLGCTTNLLGYLQSSRPNASVEEVIGGQQIVSSAGSPLSQSMMFSTDTEGGYLPVATWSNVPTAFMSTFQMTISGVQTNWYMPELQGQRLALTFDTNGVAQVWMEDEPGLQIATGATNGTVNVVLAATHPYGDWDFVNNQPVDTGAHDQTSLPTAYQRTNATYAVIYAFDASRDGLRARQRQLDAYRQQGYSDGSRQVVSESLNVMGLSWLLQTELAGRLAAPQFGIDTTFEHRFGRMAQEGGHGYYVDVYLEMDATVPLQGNTPALLTQRSAFFQTQVYFASALEYGLIEQMQSSNLLAASTVKLLEIANTNGQKVFLAAQTNWSTVSPQLSGYDSTSLYNNYIWYGENLLLPATATQTVGSWKGYGIVVQEEAYPIETMGMLIQGGYNGGYVSSSGAGVNPPFIYQFDYTQPQYLLPASPFNPPQMAGDPVDMAGGAFQVSATDLALGGTEPRGIHFNRYYSSALRHHNLAGMGYGWLNNYYFNLAETSATEAGLGATTPQQAAPMIVATCAAMNLYSLQPDPKNWLVTALIAKWGIDQLLKNGVSVSLGRDTIQFVKQPDGSFTPPAQCTLTLGRSSGTYALRERCGRAFNFDSSNRLASITDPYNQALNLSYNASNWVSQVSDWTNRWFTFNYSGSPLQLTSVTDSTGRSVGYGHTGADLTSVTDPENKTSTYLCDTNHLIVATKDALSQLVVSNLYNTFGQVTTQYTEGDTNQVWQIFWSGWQTVVQDPAGGQRRYFYDDKTRLTGEEDQLGNLSQNVYDGQDHVVMTLSPLGETNQTVFDGYHNPVLTIDAVGFTNQYFYDAAFNLIRAVDADGHPSTFGYNAQFSLTGATNGAGDWVAFDYNADGTPKTRTDSGGVSRFGSDQWGQLNLITYPNNLGSEGFFNNALGDVLTHTNARGFATSFQYNSRRELTNATAPTNVTFSAARDAVGNVQSTTDARASSTSYTWSPTRQLLTTTLPPAPAGTAVLGNGYDVRDWLARLTNALGKTALVTNDLAGRAFSLTDPLRRTTFTGHDADGRLTATTNAALEVTRRQWNPRGEMTLLTDAATHTVGQVFDPAGNQTFLTNRNGKVWQFLSDGANRITATISPLRRTNSVVFNDRGLPWIVRQPSGNAATNYYDGLKRLTNHTDSFATTLHALDADGNTLLIANAGQPGALSFGYNAYDWPTAFTNADGYVIGYQYDKNGNPTVITYPGNRSVTNHFDSLNRLTNVVDWLGNQTFIDRDLAGRVTGIRRFNGTVRVINRDDDGEITNIVEKTATGFPIAFFTLGWANSGRVAWEFGAPLPQTNALPSRTMTFNDDNQLATFRGPTMGSAQAVTVDPDGNLTFGPGTNDTFNTYTFNVRNWLLAMGNLQYGYDPGGYRTSITNGASVTRLVINPVAALPQVLMRIRPGITNYYIYGEGLLYEITETAAGINTLTYHFDLRGSTVALTDSTGMPTDRIQYSSYGLTTYRAGTNDTPFLYNGRYGVMTDANGLLYMRARYYSPYLCRFINPDPSGFAGGLNWYCYADGNPVSMVDPFGLCAEGWGGATATWLQNNVVNPLNSVSTSSTLANYYVNNTASFVGGMADLLRVGQGSANATYNAQDGWDVAIGITQDVGRAAGIATIVGGGLEGLTRDTAPPATPNAPAPGGAPIVNGIAQATTGRAAAGVAEQMVMQSAAEGNGTVIMRGPFGDPAFQSPGWVKVQVVGRGTQGSITVHYMRNEITGATTQYKFVTEPYAGPTQAVSP